MAGRLVAACVAACIGTVTAAQGLLPEGRAVESLGFSASLLGGEQGGAENVMAVGSVALPLNDRLGFQFDLAAGRYTDTNIDESFTSAAFGLHLFRRDPERGMIGLYADWGYTNPEHGGRFGVEGALYRDRWTLGALVGVRSGTNLYTRAFDEIDVTYYFSDGFKGSVGHRYTARGHVANLSAEFAPAALPGWSLFGEVEAGEDDNRSAYAGLRYVFGGQRQPSLMARDRRAAAPVRIPRNIVDLTRCGTLPEPRTTTFGLREESLVCASKEELDDAGAIEGKKKDGLLVVADP